MDITVLGPIGASSAGVAVATSANQRLLLAMLVARDGDVVPSDLLVDALWGDATPRNPRAALQNVVSRLRARMGPDDIDHLQTRPTGYVLRTDAVSVDRLRFIDHIRDARAASDPQTAVDGYDRALRLWGGEPYAEFDVPALREDGAWLSELHALAVEERLAWCVRVDPAGAVAELEALAAAQPFRERLHSLLMEGLYRNRRQRDALAAYVRYRTALAEEYGLDPSPEMQALEHAILTDTLEGGGTEGGGTVPILGGGTADRHNVGPRRTSFVGRSAERAAISSRIRSEPLLTLVGAGGAGKTSLATEVARELVGRFEGGVWIIDLLQVSGGDRIPELIAATIGLPRPDAQAPLRSLVDRVRARELLLVLDNCEHVVDAAAAVADALLEGAPGVRVLATGRQPLRVTGEVIHHVEPLALPDDTATLAEVLASPSGRLFVDRVIAADDRFRADAGDADLIRTICRRLDGLPLALELAAARVPSLGLREVAERLTDRFGLLTSDRHGAIEHHLTLRAAIAWSVDLLDDRQRTLLARLSVFAGSFDLVAAEAVCADGTLPTRDIPGELVALVERSLVVGFRSDRSVRYRLLETVREFASVELGGLADESRARHREWCLAQARKIGDGFLVHTAEWYARLRVEFPNLRAAFTWSMERGDVEAALDLASALRWAPHNTGHLYREHRDWVQQAVAAARVDPVDDAVLGRGLVSAGGLAGLETRSREAVELLDEAVALLTRLGATGDVVWAHMWLAGFRTDLGDYEAGIELASAGLDLARRVGSAVGEVYLANQLGENAMAASRLQRGADHEELARDALSRALRISTRHHVEEGSLRARHGLAFLDADEDPARALDTCEEVLAGWRRLGAGNRLVMGLVSSARVALAADDDRCGALLREAAETLDRVGWKQALGRLAETAAVRAAGRHDVEGAAALWSAASQRFLTPRWFVPIGADDHLRAARISDRVAWAAGVDAGAGLDDDSLIRAVAAGGLVCR